MSTGNPLLPEAEASGPITSRELPGATAGGTPFETCGPAPERELRAVAVTGFAEEHPLAAAPLGAL